MARGRALVLAGTHEGRDLVRLLREAGFDVLVSVVTPHAAGPYAALHVPVQIGAMDRHALQELAHREAVDWVIDATHPYAAQAHVEVREASRLSGIPAVRYERAPAASEESSVLRSDSVRWAGYDEAAADIAFARGGCVFLTTGTRQLPVYVRRWRSSPGARLVVRLVPTVENLQRCAELGIDQADIVALQGPFSEALNAALYEKFEVTVLVTKESGTEGGLLEKIRPALERGAQVVVVRRPALPDALPTFGSLEALVAYLVEHHG